MECTVIYRGKQTGQLRIERQGLYYRCTAECTFCPQMPLRLYAVRDMEILPIGVLSADGKLQKTISVRMFGQLPTCAVIGKEENGFLPWSGTVDAEKITDAYLKDCGDTQLLALPTEDGAELPLITYAQQMQPDTVCGRPCFVLTLYDGKPKQEFSEEPPQEELFHFPEED